MYKHISCLQTISGSASLAIKKCINNCNYLTMKLTQIYKTNCILNIVNQTLFINSWLFINEYNLWIHIYWSLCERPFASFNINDPFNAHYNMRWYFHASAEGNKTHLKQDLSKEAPRSLCCLSPLSGLPLVCLLIFSQLGAITTSALISNI